MVSPTIWILLQVLIPLLGIYVYFFWSKRDVSGPTPIPVLGNQWQQIWFGQVPMEMEWSRTYGKIYGMYGPGGKPILTVLEPELIKQIMVKDFHLFVNRPKVRSDHEIWGKNLFGMEGEDWKFVRSPASPSFTSGKLKRMAPLMSQCVEKLNSYFENLCSTKSGAVEFCTKEVFSGFTIDVIASTAFATETNSNDESLKKSPFVHHGIELFNFKIPKILALAFLPYSVKNRFGITLPFPGVSFDFFVNLTRQVIRDRKEKNIKRNDLVQLLMDACEEVDSNNQDYQKLEAIDSKDFIDDENNPKTVSNKSQTTRTLTDNEIIAQCIIFFIAGFETTASTITNCMFELARNSQLQEHLFESLNESLWDLEENSDEYLEAVTKHSYLDAVIKETLRKYPPLLRLDRRVGIHGYKLGGIELNKDQHIQVSNYAIHHNAEFYPEPERFNPDRFMPENKDCLIPYTYMSFGQGPRNCVGMRFALQEMKMCFAKIVTQFKFSSSETTPERLEFGKVGVLLSVKKFSLNVTKR